MTLSKSIALLLGSAALCLGFVSVTHAATAKKAAAPKVVKEATTSQEAIHKVCDGCHDTQIVMDTPKSYDEWHDTVQSMIDRGARGTPHEFDLIMDYLYQNMSTVDVNHSDADTIETVLQVNEDTAKAIMAQRDKQRIPDLATLEKIPGVDAPTVEAKKRMIFFGL